MGKIIKIGMDAEFMAYNTNGDPVYPLLDKDNLLRGHGCDEFGHCVEVRPKEAINADEFVTNVMKSMSKLPPGLSYKTENMHTMDKKTFIKLLRALGTAKSIPTCKNIYKSDILNDCEADIEARKIGKRIVFCGMHTHVSAVDVTSHNITINGKNESREIETPIELPVNVLVYLFDHYIFNSLSSDKNANIGRYRSKGFYEMKSVYGEHFEYRSLGSSAFTPIRVKLIFDMIKEIVGNVDFYAIQMLLDTGQISKHLYDLQGQLSRTKRGTKDLRKLWVPWE